MKGKIATIGFFDGVHKGHRYLIDQLHQIAQQRGLSPLVVTFRQHPRAVLQSDYVPQLLTTLDERLSLLQSQTPEVLVLDFQDIQTLTAEEFMLRLRDEQDVRVLLMGYDHMFGSDRLRHTADYVRIGQRIGMEVVSIREFVDGEWHISSTEIRQALQNGNILVANELLGYPYSLTGVVVEGNRLGRTIGFPTANIRPDDPHKIIPKSGVYTGQVAFPQPSTLDPQPSSIINIGTNPTVGNTEQTIEVHIPGLSADIYGQRLTVSFLSFIRDERKFDSLNALRRQIETDLSRLH
ncbi:MAG: riboflavin biosynthesis protein RibF [Paludibacteraceae bacterium]|nr:riboflavin biosynthesis protein RibF [Paludibacteraceae bacterium]